MNSRRTFDISFIEELRARYSYNPDTGLVSSLITNKVIGYPCTKGAIQIDYKKDGKRIVLFAHILAWAFMTDKWPEKLIDHIDLDKTNNKWGNLREATNGQNQANTIGKAKRKSKYKGVHWRKREKCWAASITSNKKTYNLGYYKTEIEAHVAYCRAADKFHGEFARYA